jgi:hypothetical protein
MILFRKEQAALVNTPLATSQNVEQERRNDPPLTMS